jgi:SAM-dependent methyltransferase
MSISSNSIFSKPEIIDFYTHHLKDFGDSSQGVGWKNDLAQHIRFSQLIKVIQREQDFSINDFGCGTGELYNYLLQRGFSKIEYRGYDILEEMVVASKKKIRSVFQYNTKQN